MGIFLYFLTVAKILMTLLLVYYTVIGNRTGYMVFIIAIMTIGFVDDCLSRKYNLFSLLRARICTWTDFITFPIIVGGAWILWPLVIQEEVTFLLILVLSFYVPKILGFVKYSRLTSYHTWLTRISSILLGIMAILLFIGGPMWPFQIAISLYLCGRMEEAAITAILPEWELNVPTLLHAVSIQRGREEADKEKAEVKLRLVLANISECYFEVNIKGDFTFFNQTLCKYLGYKEHELLGMNNRQIMPEEMAKKAYELFNEVYRTGKPLFASDWEIYTKQGAVIYFEAFVSLLRDSKGVPIGFRGIGRDITDRKKAEASERAHQEKLYHASKMVALGALVSGVAHEINNPNNFIKLNTPILREAWESVLPILDEYFRENGEFAIAGMDYTAMSKKIPTLLEGIEAGSDSIKKIVQDLKFYVRDDTPGYDGNIDLNKVVESSLSLISNMIHRSTRQFTVHYGQDLPNIKGNFQRLEQVIINLVQNACQALPDNSRAITLSTETGNGSKQVKFSVKDDGTGIPKEILPKITDQFFTTKKDEGGLGLGLSISKQIIEEHNGTMIFESEEGTGTTVEVVLPAS
jgi:PAS domain S-box-containing protein